MNSTAMAGLGACLFVMAVSACTPAPDVPDDIPPDDIGVYRTAPDAGPAPVVEPVPLETADDSSCPDDGPRFPVSGICQGRSINYLEPGLPLLPDTPDECEWVMQETAFPGGDPVLLYRARRCGDTTTKLQLNGGAQSADLTYEASAGGWSDEDVAVRVFGDGESDPLPRIKRIVRELQREEIDCVLEEVENYDGLPDGAYLIVPSVEAALDLPIEGPNAMCGEFGLDEDAFSYWRVFGGYAWFFQLGQDIPEIDPASFVLLTKAEDGGWMVAPDPAP